MSRLMLWLLCTAPVSLSDLVLAQMQSTSNTQAAQFAVQSITALTGGNSISGRNPEGQRHLDGGIRQSDWHGHSLGIRHRRKPNGPGSVRWPPTEIRDASNGVSRGKWVAPSGTSGKDLLAQLPNRCRVVFPGPEFAGA